MNYLNLCFLLFSFNLISISSLANSDHNSNGSSIALETSRGLKNFNSFNDIVEAARSGEIQVDEIQEGIKLTKSALHYENIKTNVKYSITATGVATLFFFHIRAHQLRGYANAMSSNQTYTLSERNLLISQAQVKHAQAMKNLALIGLPATIASVVVLMLPDDRNKLAAELEILDQSLTEALRLRRALESSRKLN